MNKYYLLFLAFFALSHGNKHEKRFFEDTQYNVSYEITNGRLNGKYISYYKDGSKRSKGYFKNNYRSGVWTVWDTTGRIRMKRNYTDPFNFERIIPPIPKEKPIQLLNVSQYTLNYNSEGYFEYFDLQERMIVWESRIWRFLPLEKNPHLIEDNRFFNSLNKHIIDGNIQAFSAETDDFRKELQGSIDTNSISLVGFKIKEDTFFDNERFVMETRIIGICPVVVKNSDTLDFYWLYMPYIRDVLAKDFVQATDSRVKTFDDLFFFRYFTSIIYKQSNINDKAIADYKSGTEIEKEAERIELSLIEKEHDLWMFFTK